MDFGESQQKASDNFTAAGPNASAQRVLAPRRTPNLKPNRCVGGQASRSKSAGPSRQVDLERLLLFSLREDCSVALPPLLWGATEGDRAVLRDERAMAYSIISSVRATPHP
jgi:hypothetical protein